MDRLMVKKIVINNLIAVGCHLILDVIYVFFWQDKRFQWWPWGILAPGWYWLIGRYLLKKIDVKYGNILSVIGIVIIFGILFIWGMIDKMTGKDGFFGPMGWFILMLANLPMARFVFLLPIVKLSWWVFWLSLGLPSLVIWWGVRSKKEK